MESYAATRLPIPHLPTPPRDGRPAARLALCSLAAALLSALAPGCLESQSPSCKRNSDCIGGYLCNPSHQCVEAEPVSIVTESLPNATVGDPTYRVTIEARGGFEPYRFSLATDDPELDWLTIGAETGVLRADDGLVPEVSARNLLVEITVTDESNAGEGGTASKFLELDVGDCSDDVVCYKPDAGACTVGLQDCRDGFLAGDCHAEDLSADREHCGAQCGVCPETADRCFDGLCQCGNTDPCEPGLACCAEGCFELDTARNHCGGCGVDCEQIYFAEGAFCHQGSCDYNQCEPGHFSCDGIRANGCETPSDLNNCSGCGDDCADLGLYPATEAQRCAAGVCEYECRYGSFDCVIGAPGCETSSGIVHCSGCDDRCDDTAVYLNTTNQACQDQVCRFECLPGFGDCDAVAADGCEADFATDDQHCGDCDDACDPGEHCAAGRCLPLEWVDLPAGSFQMGSEQFYDDEEPIHPVSVPAFQMTRSEITIEVYRRCVDALVCSAPDDNQVDAYCNWGYVDRDKHPVNCVDWIQARQLCEFLGGRLPSEAEWEYAARSGGLGFEYPWGSANPTCHYAVFNDGSGAGCGQDSTWPVCSKPAGDTGHGLCDMAGNIGEFTEDWYHDSYAGAPDDGSAWTDPAGQARVIRGGDFIAFNVVPLRTTRRFGFPPADRIWHMGLRCVR